MKRPGLGELFRGAADESGDQVKGFVVGELLRRMLAEISGGTLQHAGLFAVQILAMSDNTLADKLAAFKEQLEQKIAAKDARLQENIKEND